MELEQWQIEVEQLSEIENCIHRINQINQEKLDDRFSKTHIDGLVKEKSDCIIELKKLVLDFE
tara:strand:+ start:2497 stop:2685 length:189 start_codon:yes stop_codon:yes gene_type:complete